VDCRRHMDYETMSETGRDSSMVYLAACMVALGKLESELAKLGLLPDWRQHLQKYNVELQDIKGIREVSPELRIEAFNEIIQPDAARALVFEWQHLRRENKFLLELNAIRKHLAEINRLIKRSTDP